MEKTKVDHHASIIIIKSEDDRFVLGGYDKGYPWFPNYGQLIGGNNEVVKDFTPWDILRREVIEEISSVGKKDPSLFAEEVTLDNIRNSILENAQPYADFLVSDPIIEKELNGVKKRSLKPGRVRESVISVYESIIPNSTVSTIEKIIKDGKHFVGEYDTSWQGIVNKEDLLAGKPILAWCSPGMMSDYLRSILPNPHNGSVSNIGVIRCSLRDYLDDFDYIDPLIPSRKV